MNQSQSNDDENSTKKNKIRNKIKDDDDKYNEDKNNDKKIVDFLIKCIKYHGNKASILFNLIDFQNDGIEYLIEKINMSNKNDQKIKIFISIFFKGI